MIYMTTDTWCRLSQIIMQKNWEELVKQICTRSYDFDITQEALDRTVKVLKERNN